MIKAEFIAADNEAENVITFWFKPESAIRYDAGQFAQIQLFHNKPDKRGIKRWFTLSSSPTEELLAITTKYSSNPSSFKKQLFNLKPGDNIEIGEPMGDFVLPIKKDRPLIFAAAGIGSTPYRSMVKFLTDKNQKRQIDIIYYEKSIEKIAFKDLFETYGVNYNPVIANRKSGNDFYNHLLKYANERPDSLVFIAGPEPMVENAYYFLTSQDIAAARLVTDYYHNYEAF